MQDWIVAELKTVDLGDARLNKRLARVVEDFSQRPTASIPAACKGRNEYEAAYRLFDNERAGATRILAPHRDATLQRLRQQPVVLLAQDTTEFDLTRPQEKVGGPLNDEHHTGLYAHPLVAFTPDGLPLGTVHAEIWARDPKQFRKKHTRKRRALADKESHCWLEGYRQACRVQQAAPDTEVICLSDSEGDIYEVVLQARPEPHQPKARFITRACQDRSLADPAADGPTKLFAAVAASPALATLTIQVSRRLATPGQTRKRKQARVARETTVTVRAARVKLRGPQRPGGRPENLEVNVVWVCEEAPPAGVEPVTWLLVTDLPIGTPEDVLRVVAYYCVRWQIEVLFFVLKSGCQVEKRQLETPERFTACLAVYLIVAWRILYMTLLGRQDPEASCEVLFDEEEWRAAYTVVHGRPAPEEPPPLREMIGLVARLGGHTGRSADRPAGPKVMWLGLQRLRDLAACWRAFGPGNGTAKPPPTAATADPPPATHKQPPNSTICVVR